MVLPTGRQGVAPGDEAVDQPPAVGAAQVLDLGEQAPTAPLHVGNHAASRPSSDQAALLVVEWVTLDVATATARGGGAKMVDR